MLFDCISVNYFIIFSGGIALVDVINPEALLMLMTY